ASGPQRTTSEDRPITRPVDQLDALALAEEHQGVLADRVAAAHAEHADLLQVPGAAERRAIGDRDLGEGAAGRLGDGLTDAQRGAGRGVALEAVVQLDELGLPLGPERGC